MLKMVWINTVLCIVGRNEHSPLAKKRAHEHDLCQEASRGIGKPCSSLEGRQARFKIRRQAGHFVRLRRRALRSEAGYNTRVEVQQQVVGLFRQRSLEEPYHSRQSLSWYAESPPLDLRPAGTPSPSSRLLHYPG